MGMTKERELASFSKIPLTGAVPKSAGELFKERQESAKDREESSKALFFAGAKILHAFKGRHAVWLRSLLSAALKSLG